jgi:class 3 adenylate cyclase
MTMNATSSFLSVLAAGITGNARLYKKLDGPEASLAVDRCLTRIQRSVEANGGRVFQSGGGEVLASFGMADATLNAAIEIQERIADLPPVSGVKMGVRVGIACGGAGMSSTPLEDELVMEAAYLVGVAKPGQILAVGRIDQALPETMRALTADAGVALPNGAGRKEPVLIINSRAAPSRKALATGCLRLRYGENDIALDEHKSVIKMGREETCDIVIRDPRASRRHATIKHRGNSVVLIDQSTNGTYVTIDGDTEQFVKHGECFLRGHGVIAFAASSFDADADCARFECD